MTDSNNKIGACFIGAGVGARFGARAGIVGAVVGSIAGCVASAIFGCGDDKTLPILEQPDTGGNTMQTEDAGHSIDEKDGGGLTVDNGDAGNPYDAGSFFDAGNPSTDGGTLPQYPIYRCTVSPFSRPAWGGTPCSVRDLDIETDRVVGICHRPIQRMFWASRVPNPLVSNRTMVIDPQMGLRLGGGYESDWIDIWQIISIGNGDYAMPADSMPPRREIVIDGIFMYICADGHFGGWSFDSAIKTVGSGMVRPVLAKSGLFVSNSDGAKILVPASDKQDLNAKGYLVMSNWILHGLPGRYCNSSHRSARSIAVQTSAARPTTIADLGNNRAAVLNTKGVNGGSAVIDILRYDTTPPQIETSIPLEFDESMELAELPISDDKLLMVIPSKNGVVRALVNNGGVWSLVEPAINLHDYPEYFSTSAPLDVRGIVLEGKIAYLSLGKDIFVADYTNPEDVDIRVFREIGEDLGTMAIASGVLYVAETAWPGESVQGRVVQSNIAAIDIRTCQPWSR